MVADGSGDEDELDELAERMRRARSAGRILAAVDRGRFGGSALVRADELLSARGHQPLGSRWLEVDRETALQTLIHLLSTDLAAGEPRMDAAQAALLATAWLAMVSPASLLTNGAWVAGVIPLGWGTRVGPFWTPATSDAFDGGVIAVAPAMTAMLWVQDEG